MKTNEWKTIIKALDSADTQGLSELSPQDLLKLNALLDHWQKITGADVSKRIKNMQFANGTQ